MKKVKLLVLIFLASCIASTWWMTLELYKKTIEKPTAIEGTETK